MSVGMSRGRVVPRPTASASPGSQDPSASAGYKHRIRGPPRSPESEAVFWQDPQVRSRLSSLEVSWAYVVNTQKGSGRQEKWGVVRYR